MESRGNFGGLIGGVGLQFFDVIDQALETYSPGIFQVLPSVSVTGAQENYTSVTGIGELRKFDGDGEDITTARRHQSYTTKALWTNYGTSVEVSYNQLQDNDYQAELDAAHHMAIAANFSQDKSGVQLFNGGFSTATNVNSYDMTWYGDGVPLFSTVHPTPVPGASTQSNASSTGIKLSDDNLETGRVALLKQQQDNGVSMTMAGTPMLVLPLTLEKTGKVITMSERQSGNANNDINIYRNGFVDMMTTKLLDAYEGGSDTAWYMVIPGQHKLVHAVRQAPAARMSVNERNLASTFSVNARWAEVAKDWRGVWGSKGDLAAYSS
jgi:hypothetical protein